MIEPSSYEEHAPKVELKPLPPSLRYEFLGPNYTYPMIVNASLSAYKVMCDASDFALGAILGQQRDNKPYAISYAGRTLDEAQINYVMMEKEFLAVVFALEKFWSYLINSKVINFTDHAALKHLGKKSDFNAMPHLMGSSPRVSFRDQRQPQARECDRRSFISPRPRS